MKFFMYMVSLVFLLVVAGNGYAAVGCDLNDPDRDVARLFPESTGYRTHYLSIDQQGGPPLLQAIEERLGDPFQGLYETIDVPYTLYEIFRDEERIGYIHGVNEKGRHGGIQVFLVLDTEGNIRSLYFQKLTSRAARQLRTPEFGQQFVGLNLSDFYKYSVQARKNTHPGKVEAIQNPMPEAEEDFRAALRATKKNLILMDAFVYDNRYLHFFEALQSGEQP
jgi:hypothetical protein